MNETTFHINGLRPDQSLRGENGDSIAVNPVYSPCSTIFSLRTSINTSINRTNLYNNPESEYSKSKDRKVKTGNLSQYISIKEGYVYTGNSPKDPPIEIRR